MQSTTNALRKCRFTTDLGHEVLVLEVRTVGRNVTGVAGLAEATRTWALVDGEHEVELQAGCAFQAASAVRDAGFGVG